MTTQPVTSAGEAAERIDRIRNNALKTQGRIEHMLDDLDMLTADLDVMLAALRQRREEAP